MKLVNPLYFEPVEIIDYYPETIVIERVDVFRDIVRLLFEQYNTGIGNFVLSENNDILDMSKTCVIINDFFNLNFNDRNIKSRIINELLEESSDEEIQPIILQLNQLADHLISNYNYSITNSSEITAIDLLKLFDFKYDATSENILEILLDYFEICTDMLKKKCIITINLGNYMTDEELIMFKKTIQLKNINLFMIERSRNNDDSNHYSIIDSDYCVL